MKLYKIPLSLNRAYSDLAFTDYVALMRWSYISDQWSYTRDHRGSYTTSGAYTSDRDEIFGLPKWLLDRQPTSVRGFMWEFVYHEDQQLDFAYFHMLVDEEGAALARLGTTTWTPPELYENPNWSTSIDQYGGEILSAI